MKLISGQLIYTLEDILSLELFGEIDGKGGSELLPGTEGEWGQLRQHGGPKFMDLCRQGWSPSATPRRKDQT